VGFFAFYEFYIFQIEVTTKKKQSLYLECSEISLKELDLMPEHEKQHSSGVAKGGLITGIIGTTLGVLNGADGLLGGRGGYGRGAGADYVCRHELEREENNKREHNRTHDKLVTKEVLKMAEKLAAANDEIARLKSENYTDTAVAPLQAAISNLETKAALTQRDIQDVVEWAKNTFVEQEKGYVDGRRINFHGTHPKLGVNGGDERFPKNNKCNCDCDLLAG